MSRPGYLALLGALVVSALAGGFLVRPDPRAWGAEEVTCADFLGAPRAGRFHLRGCEVQGTTPLYHLFGDRVDDVLLPIRRPGFDRSLGEPSDARLQPPPRLMVLSEDATLLTAAQRVHAVEDDADRHRRYVERHRADLVRVMDLEGEVGPARGAALELVHTDDTLPERVLVIDTRLPDRPGRAFGWVLLVLGLLGGTLLVVKQRAWTRARERATGGTRPVQF